MTQDEFINLLREIFGGENWPKPLHLLRGVEHVRHGEEVSTVAKAVRTVQKRLEEILVAADPIQHVLGLGLSEIRDESLLKATQILGQLLLGRCAELAFENIFRSEMHAHELELRDL